jgi:hypothetical protein
VAPPVMDLCDVQTAFGDWKGHYVLLKQVRIEHRFPSDKEPDESFRRETTTFEWHDLYVIKPHSEIPPKNNP